MDTILSISNISKGFVSNFGGDRVLGPAYRNVIDRLSIDLERGKVTSLVGGNGAGKTTLFNLISGLLRPDHGEIHFLSGNETTDCTREQAWNIASAGIGRMFQGTRIFGQLPVLDHLLIQARPVHTEAPFHKLLHPFKNKKGDKELLEKIYEDLKQFNEFRELWEDGSRPASSLSYARQRLLSLAGLMTGGYELLLLDEPSSGLSHDSFDTMYRCLEVMRKRGRSVFLIEHNMEFIQKAADHCHFMAGGKISYSGTPDEVLNLKEVKQSYLL